MTRSTRRRSFVGALLVAIAFAGFQSNTSADHAWGSYHWARTGNPFTLQLGDNLSPDWDPYLSTTSLDWSVSSVLDTVVAGGGTNPKRCRPTGGRVEVCNSRYGRNGWLGIAQIWVSGSHITQGVVKVNDTYFNTATYNDPAWKNLVMCQEVGHTFGLAHQDENFNNPPLETCMDYSSNPLPNQHPNQHDYDQLETIYSHVDSTTTVGSAAATKGQPPAMGDLPFDTPGQWGRLVARSRNGKAETYEIDFGNGHKVVTFVIWA